MLFLNPLGVEEHKFKTITPTTRCHTLDKTVEKKNNIFSKLTSVF